MADKQLRGGTVYNTLLIWPYAVAPAIAGVLWLFMFQPSLGMIGRIPARASGSTGTRCSTATTRWRWSSSPRPGSRSATISCSSWPACSRSRRALIEAAAIDGARPVRRFWTIVFPLLSPTTFFLLVVNIVYVFFDTFGIIDAITQGGPARATETLVYKVYSDGRLGGDLGGSAAQSVDPHGHRRSR